uniref:FAE domain-containing protein n=1 Tax=Triticum urartu TaxID=4572 RepID=A0A8R7QY83_TRIUA
MEPLLMLTVVLLLVHAVSSLVRTAIARRRYSRCYLLDYVCLKMAMDRKVSADIAGRVAMRNKRLGVREHRFLLGVILRSGIGEESYCPCSILEGREESPTH